MIYKKPLFSDLILTKILQSLNPVLLKDFHKSVKRAPHNTRLSQKYKILNACHVDRRLNIRLSRKKILRQAQDDIVV
ncbi:hypothetical protein, partial [Marinilabilia sp.]